MKRRNMEETGAEGYLVGEGEEEGDGEGEGEGEDCHTEN
jgi:hypothetical protein